MADIISGWELRGKPAALFKRFEFNTYGKNRDFLDALAAWSEVSKLHPQNINFGAKYANITLDVLPEEATSISQLNEACLSTLEHINHLFDQSLV